MGVFLSPTCEQRLADKLVFLEDASINPIVLGVMGNPDVAERVALKENTARHMSVSTVVVFEKHLRELIDSLCHNPIVVKVSDATAYIPTVKLAGGCFSNKDHVRVLGVHDLPKKKKFSLY